MGQLAVHFLGQRALLQHDDDAVLQLRQRRYENIDQLIGAAGSAEAELDAIAIEGGPARLDVLDEIEERRAGGDELREILLAHRLAAHGEKRLRGDIGVSDGAVEPHGENRVRQGVEKPAGVDSRLHRTRLRPGAGRTASPSCRLRRERGFAKSLAAIVAGGERLAQ